MNIPFTLKSYNGAEFSWKDDSFSINSILFKNHKNEFLFSDCTNDEAWGNSSDYSYSGIKDAIMYNIGQMLKFYPETKEQFLQYVIKYPKDINYEK